MRAADAVGGRERTEVSWLLLRGRVWVVVDGQVLKAGCWWETGSGRER